jgi:hypothetical protein
MAHPQSTREQCQIASTYDGGSMIETIKQWWLARQREKAWRRMFLAQTGKRWWE